jgi:hypothetical protein
VCEVVSEYEGERGKTISEKGKRVQWNGMRRVEELNCMKGFEELNCMKGFEELKSWNIKRLKEMQEFENTEDSNAAG